MTRTRYFVAAMDCPTEEQIIRNGLKGFAGIEKLDFNLMDRVLTVTHGLEDPTPIKTTLDGLGMAAQPLAEGEAVEGARIPTSRWVLLGVSGALAIAAEGLAWWLEARTKIHADAAPMVIALAAVSLLLSGTQIARKGWTALRTLTLNINFLMSAAIIGAIVTAQWPEAAMASFLFALSETIEALSLERARTAISTLISATPVSGLVEQPDGSLTERLVAEVPLGARMRVRPGEKVPLDGKLASGDAVLDEAAITGESLPVTKLVGESVYAGSVNATGSFVFTVTATSGDTNLDRIVEAVKAAQAERAPVQRFIDRFARVYTPTVVIAAVLWCLVEILRGDPWREALHESLVLLVIACPCALVISTPVTLVSGLATAARKGILVKGGAFFEAGRRLKVIAWDKTGTLTEGKPRVTDVVPLVADAPQELLHLAASLNAPSEHPVAAAIVAHCRATHDCALMPVEEFQALIGRGVAGRVEGRRHFVGSHRLVHENSICNAQVEDTLAGLEAAGKSTAILTSETLPLAVLGVADSPRSESAEAISALQSQGIQCVLLTGDGRAAAQAIGRTVGISEVRAELLPEEKQKAIEELIRTHEMVGMVGDGINDAPALAKATVGIAMGEGSAAALEVADVALLRNDPQLVPEFIRLSKRVGRTLTQNITIALSIKAVFFTLALLGKATLWMAVFADLGASMIVIANGLRLLAGTKQDAVSCSHGQTVCGCAAPHD
ncbi:MAG: cation-translocating P-type ATPase [Armatimonas sp.]